MAKNLRKRTMVYSNVSRKADGKSASNKDDIINLDDEIIIGLAHLPESTKEKRKANNKNEKKSAKKNLNKNKSKNKNENKNIDKNVGKVKKKEVNNKLNKSLNKSTNLVIKEKIKKQKRRIIRKLAAISLFFLILIGGIIYFFLSPIFNIKSIEVINNSNIPKEAIINSSGIVLNENMFKMSKKEVKRAILQNPYVESVKIKRKFFDKIQIDVVERNATLMLEYGNSYVYINNQGYILEIATSKIETPIITNYQTPLEQVKPGNRLAKEDLERLNVVLNIIEVAEANEINQLITKIDVKSKNDYKLIFESEGKVVYMGDCADLRTQMLYIKKMLEKEKGIQGEYFINMDLNKNNPVFREEV